MQGDGDVEIKCRKICVCVCVCVCCGQTDRHRSIFESLRTDTFYTKIERNKLTGEFSLTNTSVSN